MASASTGCTRCDSATQARPHTIPELAWDDPTLPDYEHGIPVEPERARRIGIEALKTPLEMPRALETRLHGPSLELWREALGALERYRLLAETTVRVATTPTPDDSMCQALGEADAEPLPLGWDLRALSLAQQRRNLLWRLGRLELGARTFHASLTRMTETFGSDRSRHAEDALLAPLAALRQRLERYDTPATRPDGDWYEARLRPRFARHRPVLLLLTHGAEALDDWRQRTARDERWGYTAPTADAPLQAIERWREEHEALVEAVSSFASTAREFASATATLPDDVSTWRRCVALDVNSVARLSMILENALEMQQELANGGRWVRRLHQHLATGGDDEEVVDRGALLDETAALGESIDQRAGAIMALEVSTLRQWDEVSDRLWGRSFEHVMRSEQSETPAVTGDRATWRKAFFAARETARPGRRDASPEPDQGKTRRGRPKPPFVSEVLDLARSPARVAEVEQGLLAISELDAHLEAVHGSIANACRAGDCTGLPSAVVHASPRDTLWVDQWRKRPVDQRTLGHNILVLELSRLHLARQVERLAAFHGWFAELSSADLDWFRLPAWQQTWSLYTGTRGSYLSFLRSITRLDGTVHNLARERPERPVSPRMHALLDYEAQLFELTIDYAHYVDRGGEPPVPLETVLSAWEALNRELLAIEQATLARDERQARLEAEANGKAE